MPLGRLATAAAITTLLHGAVNANAAEITDVVDALDTDAADPFDFHIEPRIGQSRERGVIAREDGCASCDEPVTSFHRELDFVRVRTTMDVALQVGLHRNLEFHATIPFVISDRTSLEYAGGVTPSNSNVAPSDSRIDADLSPTIRDYYDGPAGTDDRTQFGTYSFFDVPNDGTRRSGLGDASFGLAWAPFDDSRNPHVATIRLGVDYTAPTGQPARGSNTGVGRGVHELGLSIAASRRVREFLEPYFALAFVQPFAAANGLFADSSSASDTRAPGTRFDVMAGTEIVLFSEPESEQHYSWDLGATFGYTLPGRDYSPLSDALSRSDCNGTSAAEAGFQDGTDGNAYDPSPDAVTREDAACAWVVQQPSNVIDDSSTRRESWRYAHNGITDIEGHGRVGGHTRFNLQFNRYVEMRMGVSVVWTNAHVITNADSGRDADGDDIVELDPAPSDGKAERNPFYNLALDPVGRRFRAEQLVDVTWDVGFAFQF